MIKCNVLSALRALGRSAKKAVEAISSDERDRLSARGDQARRHHDHLMSELEAQEATPGANAITPFMVGRTLSKLCPDAQLYEEAVTSGNPLALGFRPSEVGTYMRNGGSFLGWGLGASLGAKLADPAKSFVL